MHIFCLPVTQSEIIHQQLINDSFLLQVCAYLTRAVLT